jgi:hypothetical protein
MKNLSKILVASVLALSFATPVLAQSPKEPESAQLLERNVYLFMNGTMVSAKASDATHAMAMQEFTPIKDGTMIYVSGGKYYMASDKKLANGKMLHAEMFPKDRGLPAQ